MLATVALTFADVTWLLETLGVEDPAELWLDLYESTSIERQARYLVHAPTKTVTVERTIAMQLRVEGAPWAGDVACDPCGVA